MSRTVALCLALSLVLFLSGCSRTEHVALHHEFPPADTTVVTQIPAPAPERDCSKEFLARFSEFQTQAAAAGLPTDLGSYRVLVVHGLLGEVGLKFARLLDRFDSEQRVSDYLKDQQRALQSAGVKAEMLDYASDSVERCGAEVASQIRASDRPVLLISHSKGCLDALEALITVQREGQLSRVAGWIAIQGPFHGAPEADEISGNRFRRLTTRVALNCLGAKYDAVADMTSAVRQRYLDEHRGQIERVASSVPILTFASWKPDAKQPGTDGAVPVDSAILSGADFIAVRGLSHSATVIGSHGEFDRVAFTRALLRMMLDRIDRRSEISAQ